MQLGKVICSIRVGEKVRYQEWRIMQIQMMTLPMLLQNIGNTLFSSIAPRKLDTQTSSDKEKQQCLPEAAGKPAQLPMMGNHVKQLPRQPPDVTSYIQYRIKCYVLHVPVVNRTHNL